MKVVQTKFGAVIEAVTQAEYHENSYSFESTSFIDSVGNHEKYGSYIVLSKTIFYPHGGGQKGDRGEIELHDGVCIPIVDTRKDEGNTMHIVSKDFDINLFSEDFHINYIGSSVKTKINSEFRLKQMRLHTLAHILHFALVDATGQELPYPESSDLQDGFGANKYTFDLNITNEHVATMKDFVIGLELKQILITNYPNKDNPNYRYWKCNDYIVPCGGTHLVNMSEVGEFFLDVSNKKGKITVKFTLN